MHYRKLILFLLYSFNFSSYANNIVLPDIGDNAGNVSPIEEYRTGEAVIRNIRRAGGVIDDPLIQTYLTELGYRLVAASETQQPFHFFLIKDKSINAFALPGGFIGINAGLILATKSESELAGVMAHEIAHVTQRHHARQYEQNESSIPIMAALIAAMVLSSQNNELGQAAVTSMAAGSVQKQLNFTRENEKEADRIGIELLIKADFDAHAMPAFFDTMDKQSRLYGDNIPEFLRSHPVNPARISDSMNRANHYPNRMVISSTAYHLLQTRLKILASEDKSELLKDFSSMIKIGNYQNKDSAHYGYALALQLNKKYPQSLEQVQILLNKHPENISYNILKAQIETDLKNYPAAIKTFEKILKIYPGNLTIHQFYAETLIKAGKIKLAHKLLETQVAKSIKSPIIFQLLAETEAKMSNLAKSHQALAEYYYLQGQTHEAIKQIEISLNTKNINFYMTNRLEARLKEFKDELLQLNTH